MGEIRRLRRMKLGGENLYIGEVGWRKEGVGFISEELHLAFFLEKMRKTEEGVNSTT